MADVKNMSDALPLISLKTLNAARLNSHSESSSLRTQEVAARVVDSGERSANGQYKVTLETGGRQFTVLNDQPLPKDAELKLQLVIASQKSPERAPAGSDNPRDAAINQNQQAAREIAKEAVKETTQETTKETIRQIRLIAVDDNDDNKAEQSGKTAPTLQVSQSTHSQANNSDTDIAANLKRLAALLQSGSQGKTLNLAKDISTQDLKQWLAQKLPLALNPPGNGKVFAQGVTQTTTALYETTSHGAIRSATSASQQHLSTVNSSHNTSLLRLLPTIQQLLNKPDVPSAVKQQVNQYLEQLTSATQANGSQQQIKNSGLSYEAKLTKLLIQAAQGLNKPANTALPLATPQTVAPKTATSQTAATLFSQLWQQHRKSANTSTADSSQANQQASSTVNTSVTNLLAATKQKLESALATASGKITGNSDSTVFATSLSLISDQLQQLQNSDQKAVLSKSLLLWLNQINATRAANNEPAHNLQQLSANLLERLPEGFRLLQGALAQIELEQSQRLQQPQDQWQLNIPLLVRQDQQLSEVRMQIFKEPSEDDKAEQKKHKQRWRIHLHFDLNQLGPLDVEVDMTLPKMAATFWSTQASTLAALQQQLQPLRSKLSRLGVEVETLNARHGRLAETQRNQIQTSLVDLHT